MSTAATINKGDRFPVEDLGRELDGPAVVYFYPADFTRGCELEARTFNGLYDEFRAAGIEVIGVSTNTQESHDNWSNECALRFPLVADPDATLTGRLGLLKHYGEHGEFAARVTLLLDADGIVQRVWTVDDIGTHPAEVLEAARELRT
jgi:thioredoxin-dependent peroxiredoxin